MHPFRSALETGEIDDALELISSDVVFNSPVAFSPYHGREAIGVILRAVARVLQDFHFEREIGAEARDHALVFRARVGDRELQGCDFLHIGEDGLIDELTVMIRPLSAAFAFAEAMKAEVPVVQTEPGAAGGVSSSSRIHPWIADRFVRLPDTAHASRPWRIHELTRDFRLEDVWALPTPGGPDDFPRLVQQFASGDPSHSPSRAVRTLFAIRWKVGELLGLDAEDAGLGSRVPTLRDRLPADLRQALRPGLRRASFTSLYLLEDEWAAEVANRTMQGVMHMGWVSDGTGGYRGQMAVLVKPNGHLGSAYMAAIRPFRHLIVYPQMIRGIEREWRAAAADRTSMEAHVAPFVSDPTPRVAARKNRN